MLTNYRLAMLAFVVLLAGMMVGCDAIGPSDTTTTTQAATTTTTNIATTTSSTASTTTSTVATFGREYFPNTDGYSWTYHVDSFFAPTSYSLTMTFSGTTTVGSIIVQKQINDYQDQVFPTIEALIAVDDFTVSSYGTTQSPTTDAFVLLNFPLTVGKTWFFEGTHEATVLTKESITVPAGTFNECLLVRYIPSDRQTNYYWYARDVGLVKGISTHVDGTGTFELTSKNF